MAKNAEQAQLIPGGDMEGARDEEIDTEDSMSTDDETAAHEGTGAPLVAPGDVLVAVPEPVRDEATGFTKETLLPVSGIVRLSARELEIIDHPAFQRLFDIYQLGLAHLVYRGATHMRGEHAIGTLHTAMLLVDATRRNAATRAPEPSEHWRRAVELSAEEVTFVRLAALLHDIGHLPAGHTLEDELGLLAYHDGDERIDLILDRTEWHGRVYPSLRVLVDQKYGADAQRAGQRDQSGAQLSASRLLTLLISRDHKDVDSTPGTDFRVRVCRDLVANTICADLIDYLYRDFEHLGKPHVFDPRLLDYLEILTRDRGHGREDRVAINLKDGPRPRPDAVTAILTLLESRYQLSEVALFHRVKLAASGMLERAIAEYLDTFPDSERATALGGLVERLLECSDREMLSLFEGELERRRRHGSAACVDGALGLIRNLRVRELHRDLHILYEDEAGGPEAARAITERFRGDSKPGAGDGLGVPRAASFRLAALRTLEEDFGLDPGQIVMYCPPLEMNTKIAEVGIFFKGVLDSLASLDARNKNITGGHLAAQQDRFRRLWRVSFAIDSRAIDSLEESGMLDCLRKTIEDAVLWRPVCAEHERDDRVRRIAKTMVELDSSPWHGRSLVEPALNREEPSRPYPGGAPSIRSFIGEKAKVARRSRRASAPS